MGYFKPMSTVKMRQAPWDCPACGASPMFHPPILGKGGGMALRCPKCTAIIQLRGELAREYFNQVQGRTNAAEAGRPEEARNGVAVSQQTGNGNSQPQSTNGGDVPETVFG